MAAPTLQTGSVPVIMRIRIAQTSKPYLTHKLLAVAFCLGSATLIADPLPHLHRIRVDLSEFAVSPGSFRSITNLETRRPGRFGFYNFAQHETIGRFALHQVGEFHGLFGRRASFFRPAPAATPEPAYEWALGLLLVGLGCTSRLRRKQLRPSMR
jgi:MYXO-CTERM domain-containing protein